MKQNQSGYILILTLMVLGLATAIITRMFYQSSAFVPLSNLAVKRQKAQNLALAGVQMALSKLNGPKLDTVQVADNSSVINNASDQPSPEDARKAPRKAFLKCILPALNRWESFNFNEDSDGIDGNIKICLACEDGKINLNQLYDFTKHEFKDTGTRMAGGNRVERFLQDNANIFKNLAIQETKKEDSPSMLFLQHVFNRLGSLTQNQIEPARAYNSLCNFLKERAYQLIDVTELLNMPELSYFNQHVFYEPPFSFNSSDEMSDQVEQDDKTRPVYLMDVFTLSTSRAKLEPWLLSDSLLAILSFPRALVGDIIRREQDVVKWTANFENGVNWSTDWDKTLGQVYEVKFDTFKPEVARSWLNVFNPQAFSVLSHGTVGGVTQKLYAIIKAQMNSKKQTTFVVEKLYWI